MIRTRMLALWSVVLLVAAQASAQPIAKGQRVLTCGHSFHVWVPDIVTDLAKKADIAGHKQLGLSSIGGSRIIQHWNLPDEKNVAKKVLKGSDTVDVLTLAPIFLPDEGIENFTKLALEHNKDIRICVQPIWLRNDVYEPKMKAVKTDHNDITIEELRKRHAEYFETMDAYIREANKKLGRTVLVEVAAPHAVLTLREKIVKGEAPGLKKQGDLFTDSTGHGTPVLKTLVAYCNYATIYRRSPVGLPVPAILATAKLGDNEAKLNRMLQEIAWDAVTSHPLSGVTK